MHTAPWAARSGLAAAVLDDRLVLYGGAGFKSAGLVFDDVRGAALLGGAPLWVILWGERTKER